MPALKRRDALELIALAAIWGSSFLFIRLGAAEFGPAALAWLRGTGAALLLLPLAAARGELAQMRRHWKAIGVLGLTNSALPFVLFNVAALAISAGLAAIFNATTPLFGALFATLWLKERLDASRIAGLAIGFAGVLFLAWDKASLKPEASGVSSALAIGACLGATVLYGFSASYAKKRLTGVGALAAAGGSQLSASIALALPAFFWWPSTTPRAPLWGVALALALLCTGVAYILYFRLIRNAGPTNAVSVTFLIPAFAVLWGLVFLGEQPTASMLVGCLIIIAGTSLATGVLRLPRG